MENFELNYALHSCVLHITNLLLQPTAFRHLSDIKYQTCFGICIASSSVSQLLVLSALICLCLVLFMLSNSQ